MPADSGSSGSAPSFWNYGTAYDFHVQEMRKKHVCDKKITPVQQTVSREKKKFQTRKKNLHVKRKQSRMKKKLFTRMEEIRRRK
jgi:hypothetical protein